MRNCLPIIIRRVPYSGNKAEGGASITVARQFTNPVFTSEIITGHIHHAILVVRVE